MIKKIFYFLSIIIFVFFISNYYFSEENTNRTNKHRTYYLLKLKENLHDLPTLLSDTNDVIEYRNDLKDFGKKKIKRKFWELIGN